MQDPWLDEVDLGIINALQIVPRAPWTVVGKVLGISPVTAARRWDRLFRDGLAWVTCIPGPVMWSRQVVGFVEVDCQPAALPSVIARLSRDPRVVSIEVVAGRTDLFLTVFAADLPTLSQFLLEVVAHTKGVRARHTQLGTGVYTEGGRWRLGALAPQQQTVLTCSVPDKSASAPPSQENHRTLLAACSANGRVRAGELAERTATSISTVRRRLDRMERGRVVSFRCEVANRIAGWPVSATFWATVPAPDLAQTAQALVQLPEVRLCAAVTGGPANLIVTIWSRSVSDSQRVEALLAERFKDLRILDRAIAVQIPKRIGWLLDEQGRSVGVVPIDPWFKCDPLDSPDTPWPTDGVDLGIEGPPGS